MSLLSVTLRVYLFGGLATHKLVWEVMKRRQSQSRTEQSPVRSACPRFVKAVKLAITLGLFTQIFIPEVLPIMSDPAVLRILGTMVYTFGLVAAIVARIQLGRNWSDIEVGQVKRDHVVVKSGLYRYIRHPIYTGDLGMLLGFELCVNSWLVVAVAGIAMATIYQAIREERQLMNTVDGYDVYCERTKRFIPFVI